MKVPTWVKVVGILMILKGGCGVFQNVQNINSPKILDMQEEIMSGVVEEMEEKIEEQKNEDQEEQAGEAALDEENDSGESSTESEEKDDTENVEKGVEMIKSMLNVSDYYKKWIVIFGYVGIVVSLLSLVAGIFFMTPKRFSLPLAYASLVVSLIAAIAQYVVLSKDDSSGMITMFSGLGMIMVALVNIVLLVVIFANDKSIFYPEEEY